jgi:ribosome-associated heat shock protein Hsp15
LERQRLDKWLWHARVVKARTSAAALVEAGHVRVNGVREKSPGHAVKAGDVLTIGLDRSVRILKVAGFAERRGDASSARVLYVDLQDPNLKALDLKALDLKALDLQDRQK